MEYCANCGKELPEDAQYCFACDTRVNRSGERPVPHDVEMANQEQLSNPDEAGTATAQTKRCGTCGAQLPGDATYCFACDTRVDTGRAPLEAPQHDASNLETEPIADKDQSAIGPAMHCPNCGEQLAEDATYCAICGARVTGSGQVTTQQGQKRQAVPLWLQVAIGVCAVAAAALLIRQAIQPADNLESTTPPAAPVPSEPIAPSAASITSEPTTPPAARPTITVSPTSVSIVGYVGKGSPEYSNYPATPYGSVGQGSLPWERVSIECSDVDADYVWRATRDAPWLNHNPASGSFDQGSDDFSIWPSTDGLEEGTYTGTVSIRVDGFEGVLATLPVTLEMQAFEDPEAEAALDFWESAIYRPYWESGAQTDVREAVRAYPFPEYGHGNAVVVYFKDVDIEFSPEIYPRPISRVHCEAQFVVMEDLDKEVRTRVTYYTNTMVILQVAPGPFSTSRNEWHVVDVSDYPG